MAQKKKWSPSIEQKHSLIEPGHPGLSILRQCELLDLARSSYYHKPAEESELNLQIMRLIDEQYMNEPSWGVPRMTGRLRDTHGFRVNKKRIQRLMRLMDLYGIVPRKKKRTTFGQEEHKIYPYLLRGVKLVAPNQAWSSDITYIPMKRGFMYLVAIMDLYSRYVLSWELSNSLESQFCLDALEHALTLDTPKIFNTDKGCQYTSSAFIERLLEKKIQPSMTGKGRCRDNIHIERLWWSVKYENVYLREYKSVGELYNGLKYYFSQYNEVRPHKTLNYKTPRQVYLV